MKHINTLYEKNAEHFGVKVGCIYTRGYWKVLGLLLL
jgi:hypothetical protein